jgi:hypothetical protein
MTTTPLEGEQGGGIQLEGGGLLLLDSPRPTDIPGLVAWYSAQAQTGYTDGQAMTGLVDSSGLGNHAASVTGSPTWRSTAGSGGGPAIRFSAANTYFTLPNILSGATEGEIIATVKPGYDQLNHWSFGSSSVNNTFPYNESVNEDFGRNANVPTFSLTEWNTWLRYNVWSAANDWVASINAVARSTQVSNTVGWRTDPRLGVSGPFMNGGLGLQYGGILIFNRKLTTEERALAHGWLTTNPSGGI